MSPMPTLGRRVSAALLVSLVILVGVLAAVGAPAGAQETGAGEEGSPPRTIVIRAEDTDCPEGKVPCWDTPVVVVKPGDEVRILADFTASAQPHNFAIPSLDLRVPEEAGKYVMGGVHELNFTAPENMASPLPFICEAHPTTMTGQFVTPALLAAGLPSEEAIPEMGVHFLAYWVGVIAFALLFIVYGVTFFLFKYNETPATTDHWDRTQEPGAGGRLSSGTAGLLAILLAVAALAGIVFVARMG